MAAAKKSTRVSKKKNNTTRNVAGLPRSRPLPSGLTTGFTITKLTKDRLPSLPFSLMKERVLGKSYALSLVIAGDRHSKALNLRYRKKSYVPNVLSFPVEKKTGEIILNLGEAKRQCAQREESFRFFVALLFIHSMLHLKEYRHGSTMEKQEQKLLSTFHIKNTFRP